MYHAQLGDLNPIGRGASRSCRLAILLSFWRAFLARRALVPHSVCWFSVKLRCEARRSGEKGLCVRLSPPPLPPPRERHAGHKQEEGVVVCCTSHRLLHSSGLLGACGQRQDKVVGLLDFDPFVRSHVLSFL